MIPHFGYENSFFIATGDSKYISFVDLKSNSALLYNRATIFEKMFRPEKFPKAEL